jgi:hypothetical protein
VIMKQVSYGITIIGEPEVIYKVRHNDDFWGALADAARRGHLNVHINWAKEDDEV